MGSRSQSVRSTTGVPRSAGGELPAAPPIARASETSRTPRRRSPRFARLRAPGLRARRARASTSPVSPRRRRRRTRRRCPWPPRAVDAAAGAMTCPPRQAPSSTYRQPARSSGHDSRGSSAHRGNSASSRRDRPSARRSFSISSERARSGKPSGGPPPPGAPGGFDGSVEPVEELEHSAVSLERELRFEQPQLGLETSMQCGRFALQLLPQRRSALPARHR